MGSVDALRALASTIRGHMAWCLRGVRMPWERLGKLCFCRPQGDEGRRWKIQAGLTRLGRRSANDPTVWGNSRPFLLQREDIQHELEGNKT